MLICGDESDFSHVFTRAPIRVFFLQKTVFLIVDISIIL